MRSMWTTTTTMLGYDNSSADIRNSKLEKLIKIRWSFHTYHSDGKAFPRITIAQVKARWAQVESARRRVGWISFLYLFVTLPLIVKQFACQIFRAY